MWCKIENAAKKAVWYQVMYKDVSGVIMRCSKSDYRQIKLKRLDSFAVLSQKNTKGKTFQNVQVYTERFMCVSVQLREFLHV